MIYIVSGFMRTGTKMMMQALEAGGMDVYLDVNDKYELTVEEVRTAMLNPHVAEGKMYKCLAGGVLRLAAWKYKILYMQRNYQEIKASCDKLFGPGEHVPPSDSDYYNLMRYHAGVIDMRRDVQWIGIQYRAVLANPLAVFELLAKNGWPIDAAKAAALVDPARCHHRNEEVAA